MTPGFERYDRQALLPQIGREGQSRLARARVLLVGCGALGCVVAEQLARAGVGTLRIVDRDVVEVSNLQRQVLFDEEDAREGVPKAAAAARRLARVNSAVSIEPVVTDVHAGNVERLAGLERDGGPRVDLMVDGTDNAETRYLLNDVAVKHGVRWIYGACVGVEGRMMAVHPGRTACLRCVFPNPPGAGELPTCDTAGVLGPAAAVVGGLEAGAAIRLLCSPDEGAGEGLVVLDVWANRFRTIDLADAKRADCPACGGRRFEFLEGRVGRGTTSLCGRNAVQVRPSGGESAVDLGVLAGKLKGVGRVEVTPHLLRCEIGEGGGVKLTVFPDGRLIVHGTADTDRARSIYARYIGA